MKAGKHIGFGLVSVTLLYIFITRILNQTITTRTFGLMLIVAVIYAVLPDIDQKGSIIYRVVMFASIIGIFYLINNGMNSQATALLLFLLFLNTVTHRTVVHSLLFGAIAATPLLIWVNPPVALAGFVAFISHLITDNELSFWSEKDWKLW